MAPPHTIDAGEAHEKLRTFEVGDVIDVVPACAAAVEAVLSAVGVVADVEVVVRALSRDRQGGGERDLGDERIRSSLDQVTQVVDVRVRRNPRCEEKHSAVAMPVREDVVESTLFLRALESHDFPEGRHIRKIGDVENDGAQIGVWTRPPKLDRVDHIISIGPAEGLDVCARRSHM